MSKRHKSTPHPGRPLVSKALAMQIAEETANTVVHKLRSTFIEEPRTKEQEHEALNTANQRRIETRLELERQQQAQQVVGAGAAVGSLGGAYTPRLNPAGDPGRGAVTSNLQSRPMPLCAVIDVLTATAERLDQHVADSFKTLSPLLPPNFELPDPPASPIPTSSAPVMQIMALADRIDRARARQTVIVEGVTL